MNSQQLSERMLPKDVADELGVNIGTLAVWRTTRRYPLPWYKIGRRVFYKRGDVEIFVESCRRGASILDDEKLNYG